MSNIHDLLQKARKVGLTLNWSLFPYMNELCTDPSSVAKTKKMVLKELLIVQVLSMMKKYQQTTSNEKISILFVV